MGEQLDAEVEKRLKQLENKVKYLSTKVKDNGSDIESFKLIDFQKQIDRLNDRISDLTKYTLILTNHFAVSQIEALYKHMGESIINNASSLEKTDLLKWLEWEYSASRNEASKSPKPLDVLAKFKKDCSDCSKKYGLKAFMENP
jgi:hypothetical protein